MSLINCKECKGLVSKKANSCPTCGAKVPKSRSIGEWIGIGIVCLITFAVFSEGNKTTETKSSSAPTETAINVTSTQMAQAYDQNEAKGDALYKGKLLNVTGVVTSIDKDLTDNTVIMLNGLNDFQSVHAEVKESEESKAIDLRKGERITVQCRAKGEVIGSPMLDECTIL